MFRDLIYLFLCFAFCDDDGFYLYNLDMVVMKNSCFFFTGYDCLLFVCLLVYLLSFVFYLLVLVLMAEYHIPSGKYFIRYGAWASRWGRGRGLGISEWE